MKPEGGYGWVVCAIACWLSSSFGTLEYTFSILIGPLAHEFHTSLTIMSLGGELIGIVQYVLAPLYGMVGKVVGYRRCLIVACVLAPISIGASAMVNDVTAYIFLYCVVPGLCVGQINLSGVMILNSYFDKKLVIAHGFYKGAMYLGVMLHSMSVNYLVLNYQHQYVSYYMMSVFLVGLLLMPFFYPFQKGNTDFEKESGTIESPPLELEKSGKAKRKSHSWEEEISKFGFGSYIMEKIWKKLKEISAWSVIGNWHGCLFYLGVILYYTGFMMFYMLVVEMIESKVTREITPTKRGMITLTHSLVNGSFRMVSAFAAHYLNIQPQLLASFALMANVVVLVAFAFVNDYYWLLILVALFGMCSAPYSAFTAPTTISLFGTDASGQTLGVLYACLGLGCIPGAPLAGFVYEHLGNYQWTVLGSAMCYLLASIRNFSSYAIHKSIGG